MMEFIAGFNMGLAGALLLVCPVAIRDQRLLTAQNKTIRAQSDTIRRQEEAAKMILQLDDDLTTKKD